MRTDVMDRGGSLLTEAGTLLSGHRAQTYIEMKRSGIEMVMAYIMSGC